MEAQEKKIDQQLGIVNGQTKDYKKQASDTKYYRLRITPYYEKLCAKCKGKLGKNFVCEICGHKHNLEQGKDEITLGKLRKGYVQETVNTETGEITKGSSNMEKVLYGREEVLKADTVLYCMSENDCDYLNGMNYDFVATTSIGKPSQKLAEYLWKYYIADLQGKNIVFVARGDAEEKYFLMLIKKIILPVNKNVGILNVKSLSKNYYGVYGRKVAIRKCLSENKELHKTFPEIIKKEIGLCYSAYVNERLKQLNSMVIPEEYLDGFSDIALLKAEVAADIKHDKLREAEKQRRIAEKVKKYDLDKKRIRALNKSRENIDLLLEIVAVVRTHFPTDKKVWLIANKKLVKLLAENSIKLTPEKLAFLLSLSSFCQKKTMSRGHVNLHLTLPKQGEEHGQDIAV